MSQDRWDVALHRLFVSAFTNLELYQFLDHIAPRDLSSALPSVDIEYSAYCFKIVGALERHGACDPQFFEELRQVRPRRRSEIDAIEAALLGEHAAQPAISIRSMPTPGEKERLSPTLHRIFHYASTTKIELLLGQISPETLGELALNAGIDVDDLRAPPGLGRDLRRLPARAEVVRAHLESQGLLGAPGGPEEYFWGMLPMGSSFLDHGGQKVVFFGGEGRSGDTSRLALGLGGSQQHVLGADPGALGLGSLPRTLFEVFASLGQFKDIELPKSDMRSEILSGVCAVIEELERWPLIPTEFLAKRVLMDDIQVSRPLLPDSKWDDHRGQVRVVLGTPIYVATAFAADSKRGAS